MSDNDKQICPACETIYQMLTSDHKESEMLPVNFCRHCLEILYLRTKKIRPSGTYEKPSITSQITFTT